VSDINLISVNPNINHGQASIAGTRVLVSVILDCLAAGMTHEQILEEFPTITRDGILACIAYGALLAREEFVPIRFGD
jgi:uncharacterized protein (DUF433 family)